MHARRRLPHVYPPGRWLFVTWHLHGSLPQRRYPRPDNASAGQAFVWIDRQLDAAQSGPLFLREEAVARTSVLLKSLKGCTARQTNRMLGRTGEPFWQRESYDHWVRDEVEWTRIAGYIENNPVRAGVVARAGDYPWSSAHGVAMSGDAARTSACATSLEPRIGSLQENLPTSRRPCGNPGRTVEEPVCAEAFRSQPVRFASG